MIHRRLSLSYAIMLVCLVSTVFCLTAGAADSPYFRGPNRNGIAPGDELPDNWASGELKTAWEASVGWGFSSITISDGKAFINGNIDDENVLHCFDAENGDLIWKQSYSEERWPKNTEGGPYATPVVADGKVYTLSKKGKVYARKVSDGSVVWNVDLQDKYGIKLPNWGLAGSPLILDNMAIFNAGDYGIAFDKDTGENLWRNGKGPGGYASPVAFERDGRTLLAMFVKQEIAIVDSENGEVLATHRWKTNHNVNASDPIVFDDKVFISSGYNTGATLLQLTNQEFSEIWKNKEMRTQMNGCTLWKDHLYGFDERQLRCLDVETGKVMWRKKGYGKGTVIVADGKLVILSANGLLVTAEATPEGFNKLNEKRLFKSKCWTIPTVANGRIYARNAAGDVVCLDPEGE